MKVQSSYLIINLFMFFPFIYLLLLQPDDTVQIAIEKINELLESFLGISDTELGKILLFYCFTNMFVTVRVI